MRFAGFLAVFGLSLVGGFAYMNPKLVRAYMLPWIYGPVSTINPTLQWPAELNLPYPNLELYTTSGEKVRLSKFRGKVLVINSVAMASKSSQALSGGNLAGGLNDVVPQPDMQSFAEYFASATKTEFADSRFQLIQVIYYGPDGVSAPTLEDARQWAEHFGPVLPQGTEILFADSSMLSRETREMIPCFQLVDQNFVLRCDAGHPPRKDIFTDLMPLLELAL